MSTKQSKHLVKKEMPKGQVARRHEVRQAAPRDREWMPVERLFDEITQDFRIFPTLQWREPLAGFEPQMDVEETSRDIVITADLPGMDKEDVEITLTGDALKLRGEKKLEHEEKSKQSYRFECSYGSFERVIPLWTPVDVRKVDAHMKKGVLSITLPKVESGRSLERKIEVKAA